MKELAMQFIIDLLNDIEFSGLIDQETYNKIIKALRAEFDLTLKEAQGLTTTALKSLYAA